MTMKMTRKKTSLDPVAPPIILPFEKSAAMAKEIRKIEPIRGTHAY